MNDFELEDGKSCVFSYLKRNIVDGTYCAIVQTLNCFILLSAVGDSNFLFIRI